MNNVQISNVLVDNVRTKPTKAEIRKWVKALRSGKYAQGRIRLQDGENFCCLGVACKIFAPDYATDDGDLRGHLPAREFGAPKWLHAVGSAPVFGQQLWTLNDLGETDKDGEPISDRLTFDEIADVIELKYIHGADNE
jgi:hypothetical protein